MTAAAVRGGWSATGWDDPATGDVGSVRALSARFQQRADDLRALNVELTLGLTGLGGWQGQAADRFRENQQKLRLGLDDFAVRFERCRIALDQYAHAMDERRAESNALLPRVLDAQRRLSAAQHQILHPTGVDSLSRALWEQPQLLEELEGLGLAWARIRGAQEAGALLCAQHLQDSDGTVLHDLFRDTEAVLATGQQKLGDLTHELHQWLSENAETINEVTNVLGTVSSAVSVLSLAFPALAPAAGVLALAVAVGRFLAWQGGAKGVSWKSVAGDVAGVVLPRAAETAVRPASLALARRALSSDNLKMAEVATAALDNPEGIKKGVDAFFTLQGAVEEARPTLDYWVPRPIGPLSTISLPVWTALQRAYDADLRDQERQAAGAGTL